MREAASKNFQENWRPKRLAVNDGMAFVGLNVKTKPTSPKTGKFLLTADTFLHPKFKIDDEGFEELIYEKSCDDNIPSDLASNLKRYSAFIATPRRYNHLPIFTRIDNKDHNIIPDDSIVVIFSKRCVHLGVMYSVFYSVWHEYQCSLLKSESDYDPIEIFETFPFSEELTYQMANDGRTISDKYNLFCAFKKVGLVEAYKKIEVGANLDSSYKSIKSIKDILNHELAKYYKLPIKHINDKEKIINILVSGNKK